MKSKTFKIGECCQGGIITVEIHKSKVSIIGKEWDYSKGSNRGSDQSGAKEFTRMEFALPTKESRDMYGPMDQRDMYEFLTELTTSYYAEEVLKFIKEKI